MTEDHRTDSGVIKPSTRNQAPSEFKVARIVVVALPLAVLLILGALFWAQGGDNWFSSLFTPPLVPARVQVLYQGKPVTDGFLMTDPAASGVRGAMGFIEQDGWFTLRTDTGGKYSDGASAGIHKVAVMAFEPAVGVSAPKPLVPAQYTDLSSSPLMIDVAKSSDKNDFTITLQEDVPEGG